MRRISLLLIFISAMIASCSGERKPVEKPYLEIILEAESGTDTIRQREIIELLSARLDNYGVSQDDFSFEPDSNRIKARFSLDAIRDRVGLRKILYTNARLVFREIYNLGEIIESIASADSIIRNPFGTDSLAPNYSSKPGLFDLLKIELSDPRQAQYGGGYSMYTPLIGTAELKDTSRINHMLADSSIRTLFPYDIAFHWTQYPITTDHQYRYGLIAVKTGKNSTLDPGKLKNIHLQNDNNSYKSLEIEMSDAKGKAWARMTKANIGRSIAIEIDDHVFSYPTVQGEITGGKSQITGADMQSLEELNVIMGAGSLPVRVWIVEEKEVK